jgi:signal recognition particle receptor subunit beta
LKPVRSDALELKNAPCQQRVFEIIINLCFFFFLSQRLAGATLLVFSNKQDLPGALLVEEIRDVSSY